MDQYAIIFSINVLIIFQFIGFATSVALNHEKPFQGFLGSNPIKEFVDTPNIRLKIPLSTFEIKNPLNDLKKNTESLWQSIIPTKKESVKSQDIFEYDHENQRQETETEEEYNDFKNDKFGNFITISTRIYETTTDSTTTDSEWNTTDYDLENRLGNPALAASLLG